MTGTRLLWRPLLWAAALSLFAPLALGIAPRDDALELPEVVVRGIDQVRLDAQRAGQPPLEPARSAQAAVPLDLPAADLPAGQLRAAPPVQSPGCAYRNPVTGALARAGGDPEAYYKSALDRLAHDELDQAAFFLAAIRDKHPNHPLADNAAFQLAEIQRRQGRPAEAIAFYRLVHGEFARQAGYRLAWMLDAEGRPDEARVAWQKVAADASSPFRAEAWYRLGVDLLARGDPAAAVASLQRALAGASDSAADDPAAALYALGLAQRQLGDLSGAEHSLLQFLLQHPGHPAAAAAQTALGWVLLDRGQPGEAAHRFSWVLERAPAAALAHRALYGRVRAFVDLADRDRGERALAALEGDAPGGPWVGWARADLGWLAFRSGDYTVALGRYRDALKIWDGPGEDAPRYMVAESLYLLGRYPEADEAYRQVRAESPLRPTALHRAGLCKLLSGDPSGAEALFRQILQQYPGYPQSDRVWAWLGEALTRQKRPEEALRALRNVTAASPAYPQALYAQAWLAFDAERWDEAANLFGSFLQLAPADPNRDEALLTLARAHFNRRQPRAALEALDLLETRTGDPEQRAAARYYRGWMLARSARESEGRAVLAALIHDEPAGTYTAQAHRTLAYLDFGRGEYQAALAHFDAALVLEPEGDLATEARAKRADCLFNLGRFPLALEAYRALGESPEAAYGAALCLNRMGERQLLAAAAEAFADRYPADPRGADLFLALGRLLAEARDPAAAAAAYGRAARASGDDGRAAEAQLEAARNLAAADQPERALEVLERLGDREDALGTAALRQRALVLERIGQPGAARTAWEQFAARAEGEPRATALREAARWARATAAWDEARDLLERALAACPADELVLRQALLTDLGETQLLAGHPDQAVELLRQAGELGRSDEGLRALISLGRAQEAAGTGEEALDTYLRIGYLYPLHNPEVARALLRAGALLEDLGDPERAQQLYHKLSDEAPDEWAARARDRLPQSAPE
ncbi:MAG TPA: tetratricopeptide repeat protein [Deferrisomatales bacterium]|nr:tetratricopeptide repeat protein [Deferrisomatales bacterium]